jgi:hypothetical protein
MRQSVICSPVQEFYDVRLFYVVNGNVSLTLIVLLKLLHPLHRERSTTHHPGVLSLMGCIDGFELLIISGPFMAERRLSQDDFFISAEFRSGEPVVTPLKLNIVRGVLIWSKQLDTFLSYRARPDFFTYSFPFRASYMAKHSTCTSLGL